MKKHITTFIACLFIGLTSALLAQTQPAKPTPPAPPTPPMGVDSEALEAQMEQFEANMQAWAKEMEAWGAEMADWSKGMEAWGQDLEAWGKKMGAWGEKMGQFGEELQDMLKADGYVKKKKHSVNLKFYPDYMIVEGKKVEGQAYEKYKALLDKYDIDMGEDGEMIFNPPARH